MADHYIKQDDKYPQIIRTLQYIDGTPIDLTDASNVQFLMRYAGTETVKINRTAVVLSPALGVVRYDWQGAGDTDTVGLYEAEFEIRWSNGYQTVPNQDYISVEVVEDIANAP